MKKNMRSIKRNITKKTTTTTNAAATQHTHNKENHGGKRSEQRPQAQHSYAFKHTLHVSRSHLFDRFVGAKKKSWT